MQNIIILLKEGNYGCIFYELSSIVFKNVVSSFSWRHRLTPHHRLFSCLTYSATCTTGVQIIANNGVCAVLWDRLYDDTISKWSQASFWEKKKKGKWNHISVGLDYAVHFNVTVLCLHILVAIFPKGSHLEKIYFLVF